MTGISKLCYKAIHSTLSAEIAQSVEQRTENPCVPGSNPGLGTSKFKRLQVFPVTAFFLAPTPAWEHLIAEALLIFCNEAELHGVSAQAELGH